MRKYLLGTNVDTGRAFYVPRSIFPTHVHLLGGTGKGKTTLIKTVAQQIMADPTNETCNIIVDGMGQLSFDLIMWIASDFCPDHVRERFIYIEPARQGSIIGFNPLLYETDGHAYYKVAQTAEIILRGWESQDIEKMPRLARWLFNSFYACALLGLTVADSAHLVLPWSPYHRRILEALPPRLKFEWSEIMRARGSEVERILESTRNRMKPYHECSDLRLMFGTTRNSLDIGRFQREGKIVLINLHPGGRIPHQVADAIGGLVVNEVLSNARSAVEQGGYPTFLWLDEFQRYVSPDLQAAIPETRQLGINLVLSHQSLSQLKRGDVDLTSMIFQAQSRMIFGTKGEDADILGHELASVNYDPKQIKDERYSLKQRISGHEVRELRSSQDGQVHANNWSQQWGQSWQSGKGAARRLHGTPLETTYTDTDSSGGSKGDGFGGSSSTSHTSGMHESLVPIHEDYWELVNRTYYAFDELRNIWARDIRRLTRGFAFAQLADDPRSYAIHVKRSAPGHLRFDRREIRENFPEIYDEYLALIEKNFASDLFVSPQTVEIETARRLESVLNPPIIVPDQSAPAPGDNPLM